MEIPKLNFCVITPKKATELVIRHHYLHRRCQIEWCWGIEDESRELLGVLTIGRPAAWSAMASVVGQTHEQYKRPDSRSHDVYELNRLWISDKLPRNTESRFISWCLRELRRENPKAILISYAEGTQGHVGYVYQATNWLYLGQSAEFTDITVDGYNDYRSVPEDVRGGAVFRCKEHGLFEGMLPRKSKNKSRDLPEVPKEFPCPHCGVQAEKLRARAWAFVREEGKLQTRGDKTSWTHTSLNGTVYKMRLKQRSRKHQYVWFADRNDVKLLPKKFWSSESMAGFPYPKKEAS